MDGLLLAQAFNLIGCIIYHSTCAVLSLSFLLLYYIGLRKPKGAYDPPGSAIFYEGTVLHIRRAPVVNKFRYAVRMAVLDLDAPPSWFKSQAQDHMSADEARKFADTAGPVKLLTDPISAGYVQNPISVYYCYSKGSQGSPPRLERCIAEVTNTPWNERVSFVFNPDGQSVRKALHVSPFMDMQNTWHLEAPEPSQRLKLVVRASHPTHGDYFHADLVAGRCPTAPQHLNEEAGLRALLSYGFMPHRVALLIYWQAIKLLCKGVPFQSPPNKVYQKQLVAEYKGGPAATDADATATPTTNGQQPEVAPSASGGSENGLGSGGCGKAGGSGLCPVSAVVWGAEQHSHPRNGVNGKHFLWREAPHWPWREG